MKQANKTSLFLYIWLALPLPLMASQELYSQEELKALSQVETKVSEMEVPIKAIEMMKNAQINSQEYQWMAKKVERQAIDKLAKKTDGMKPREENLMVLTSLVTPKNSIQALIRQADQYQVPVVIKGVLKSGFKETVTRIKRLIATKDHKNEVGGIGIDPHAFRQFSITQVPAFIITRKGACTDKTKPCSPKDFDVVYGDISLQNALELLETKGRFGNQIKQIKEKVE